MTLAGERYALRGDETVSMNLWAATPATFPLLEREFAAFLSKHGADRDAEFLLSESVNELIRAGELRVRVIATAGPWLGMTHSEDKPYIVARLRDLVGWGHYPDDLSAALRND